MDREPPADEKLLRVRGLDTLEAAYQEYLEQRLAAGQLRLRLNEERARLEDQARFMLGAVKAARALKPGSTPDSAALASDSLSRAGALDTFTSEAEAKLAQARAELEARAAQEEHTASERLQALEHELLERARRFAGKVRPHLLVRTRSLPGGRKVLHLDRLSPDDSVLLVFLLTGKVPSRHGFLLDDSTEDVALPPPPFYAEEGVEPAQLREGPSFERALLSRPGGLLPIKGHVPVLLPEGSPEPRLFRMLQRGVVLEVEVATEAGFRGILDSGEAERFAGYLVSLKLDQKIELELRAE